MLARSKIGFFNLILTGLIKFKSVLLFKIISNTNCNVLEKSKVVFNVIFSELIKIFPDRLIMAFSRVI